jgi:hypothetical protein
MGSSPWQRTSSSEESEQLNLIDSPELMIISPLLLVFCKYLKQYLNIDDLLHNENSKVSSSSAGDSQQEVKAIESEQHMEKRNNDDIQKHFESSALHDASVSSTVLCFGETQPFIPNSSPSDELLTLLFSLCKRSSPWPRTSSSEESEQLNLIDSPELMIISPL